MDNNEVVNSKEGGKNTIGVTAIVAITIVCLTCILSCTGVMIAFLLNAPWGAPW